MLLTKKKEDLSTREYVVKYALIYLNMRKIKDEGVAKIMESSENASALSGFCEGAEQFLFVM